MKNSFDARSVTTSDAKKLFNVEFFKMHKQYNFIKKETPTQMPFVNFAIFLEYHFLLNTSGSYLKMVSHFDSSVLV